LISLLSSTPKINIPPTPFANELTLFSQLLGFFTSKSALKSISVAYAINVSI